MKEDIPVIDKTDVTLTGRLTSKEKELLEAQAVHFGYTYSGKGSIFRLLRAIASGDIVLVRPEKKSL